MERVVGIDLGGIETRRNPPRLTSGVGPDALDQDGDLSGAPLATLDAAG